MSTCLSLVMSGGPFLVVARNRATRVAEHTRRRILHGYFVVGGVPTGRTSIGMYRGAPPGPGHIEIRAAIA